jgi:hypothetical protein
MYNVEWELIRQKNHILQLCNDEKYEEALLLLDFSESLWKECSYAYKTREIRERIKRELSELVFQASHWKTEEKWRKLLDKVPA